MKFWLGVTDNNWFNFLSNANVDEVNFWQPNGKAPFTGLEPRAPFFFKLKSPFNHLAGGGTFVKFTTLPLSLAWEVFGIKNGAPSLFEFQEMIRKLSSNPHTKDPEIGCTIITSPFFLPKENWISNPIGWSGNIVQGKYYDTTKADGLSLWNSVHENLSNILVQNTHTLVKEPTARYGKPTLSPLRLGQGGFRVMVTDAYKRRCAITGESTLPVLEAAHILPFSKNGPHEVSNGMLLRSDFHKLFDTGLITVTPELNVEVSPRIKEEWFNGKAYYRLHGKILANLPDNPTYRPKANFLSWHNENCFQVN